MAARENSASVTETPWIESQWILLEGEVYARITARASQLGITPAALLERLLSDFLDEHERNQ